MPKSLLNTKRPIGRPLNLAHILNIRLSTSLGVVVSVIICVPPRPHHLDPRRRSED
jgi:hypothetical protein